MSSILIVDDDASVRRALQHGLRLGGYDIVLAKNGDEGIQEHRRSPVDLVIIDLFMPGKEGLETIVELRRDSPDLPIIAMSGGHLTSKSMLQAANFLGADHILQKPFDATQLLAMVAESLHPKPQRQASATDE
jgi:DNA-binding response OmpR family regulator